MHPAYERECSETYTLPTERGEREWAVRMLAEWRKERGYSADGEMSHTDHEAFAAWVEGRR